jgi:hypothetical protein
MSLVMSCLLARAKREGESVHKETAVYLLELAKSNQQIFRALVASMNAEQKGLLEGVLRSVNVGAGSGADREESTQAAGPQTMPSIALRFDL